MRIPNAEWRVLEAVWDLEPAGAAEVIQAVTPGTDWSHRTVRTLLNRLADKGALAVRKTEGRNIYQSARPRETYIREESRSFVKKVFGGSVRDLLVHFAQEQEITAEDLACLESLLDAGESSAPSGKEVEQ